MDKAAEFSSLQINTEAAIFIQYKANITNE
jgi:hypothetical protein